MGDRQTEMKQDTRGDIGEERSDEEPIQWHTVKNDKNEGETVTVGRKRTNGRCRIKTLNRVEGSYHPGRRWIG